MTTYATAPGRSAPSTPPFPIDEPRLRAITTDVLGRWPSAGVATGVVHGGDLVWFHGHGVACAGTKDPVTEDTVFRARVTAGESEGRRT